MNEYKFSKTAFERGVLLDTSKEEAYKYAATSDGIAKWFIGKAQYTSPDNEVRKGDEPAQKGDIFKWDWVYKDLTLEGEVLDANGKDYIKFSFGKTASVSIRISKVGKRILFNLTQESDSENPMEEFSHINCYVCWTLFVLNLKSVAENAADLREWDNGMHGLVNW